jgi:hypothetical protein
VVHTGDVRGEQHIGSEIWYIRGMFEVNSTLGVKCGVYGGCSRRIALFVINAMQKGLGELPPCHDGLKSSSKYRLTA